MNCPFCGAADTRVVNSRPSPAGDSVRRRRECQACLRRFTTVETIEKDVIFVVKRDKTREPFEPGKLRKGIERACEKRRIPIAEIDRIVSEVERATQSSNEREFPTEEIGKIVLRELKKIDHVAYMRFASVYKQFHDLHDFNEEIQSLLKE